eukprot:2318481-Pyramimonas_sp.AAC.1
MARSRLDLRGAPLCCPAQQPSNVTTLSHFATPGNGEVLFGSAWHPTALPRSTSLKRGDKYALRNAPIQGWRGPVWICVGPHCASPPPATLK